MLKVSEGKLVCAALEKILLTLTDMASDLMKKGITLPRQVSVALQGARLLISLCKHHPNVAHDIGPSELDTVQGFCVQCCGADVVARIECELRNAEDLIVIKAVNTLGEAYATQWQDKIGACWNEVGQRYEGR